MATVQATLAVPLDVQVILEPLLQAPAVFLMDAAGTPAVVVEAVAEIS